MKRAAYVLSCIGMLYLGFPLIAGFSNLGKDRRGPKIYPRAYHELLFRIGYHLSRSSRTSITMATDQSSMVLLGIAGFHPISGTPPQFRQAGNPPSKTARMAILQHARKGRTAQPSGFLSPGSRRLKWRFVTRHIFRMPANTVSGRMRARVAANSTSLAPQCT